VQSVAFSKEGRVTVVGQALKLLSSSSSSLLSCIYMLKAWLSGAAGEGGRNIIAAEHDICSDLSDRRQQQQQLKRR